MNLVDSSCWIEYLTDSEIGAVVAPIIEDIASLVVPSVCLYEVYKKLANEKSEAYASEVVSYMRHGKIVVLDAVLAISAADVSRKHRLSMTDSIIYAAALQTTATLWTSDKHFQGIHGVCYLEKSAL